MTKAEIDFLDTQTRALNEQTEVLHKLVEAMMQLPLEHSHTLTEAADSAMLGVAGVILLALLVYIWQDTKAVIKGNRAEGRAESKELKGCIIDYKRELKIEFKEETDRLWDKTRIIEADLKSCKARCDEKNCV